MYKLCIRREDERRCRRTATRRAGRTKTAREKGSEGASGKVRRDASEAKETRLTTQETVSPGGIPASIHVAAREEKEREREGGRGEG